MNKVSIRSIVSGLYLQVSRDDQGSLDHPRGCWPGIVGPRAVRHRARLVPLHKAEARLRRLRIAANTGEQQ